MFWNRNKAAPKVEPVVAEPERKAMKINAQLLAQAQANPAVNEFVPYAPPTGVIPKAESASVLAMDSTPYDYLNTANLGFQAFQGYPYLAQLALRPEYRMMVDTIAEEMTRKWISLHSIGDDEGKKQDKLDAIDAELKRLNAREVFRKADENDGYFGRGQIYVEMKAPGGALASTDPLELEAPLFLDPAKVPKGSLVSLRSIEPVWTYPTTYNADNPLSPTFYKPEGWYVMAKKVHNSRLLLFISRPVPDLFKSAYNFGGLSLSQIAEPYVGNWLRTRDSVGDMIHMFSTSGILTDMTAVLAGDGGTGLMDRLSLYTQFRDNKGAFVLDKATEEFFQFNTPLGGLDALQAQAQEQMASISHIPLVKLLGVTPSGLNASSDGEIRVFYDSIHARQENLFRPPLKRVIDLIQLSLFGVIDPDIDFRFEPLYQMSELDQANVRKIDADTDAVYITNNVISTDEARESLAADPESRYHSLELNAEIDNDQDEDDDPTDSPTSGSA